MGTYHFFTVFLIVITYAHITFGNPVTNSQYTLCATDECINAASEILAKLNRTVDPCDDFYKYACGEWLQTNQANLSFPKIDFFSVLAKKAQNQLREILETPANPNDTMSLQKAKHIFAQCMDKDNEAVGKSNLSAVVNSYGGWPMVMSRHEWNTKNVTWQNVSTILHKNEFNNGLFIVEVFVDHKMSNSNVIYIFEPFFSFPRDEMIQLNNTQSLKDALVYNIVRVAKNLINETGKTEMNNFTQDALDIVNFEVELAKLTSTVEAMSDVDQYYIPLTIQHLQEEYDKQQPKMKGKIDWHSTIQEWFASEEIAIEPSETLVVPAYKYLTHLVSLLERTPSRTIVNYMQWTVIKKLIQYNKELKANGIARVIMNPVNKQLGGNDTRWMSCINTRNLKFAISHEYIKKYILLENIGDIKEISTDVKDAIRQQIRNATWMDEPTKEAALEKLAYMKQEFFNPDWYSDEAIDRYYEDLNVSMGYLDNMINIFKFEMKKTKNSLRTPVNKNQWFLQPTIPEAYNTPFFNKIILTAALLQNPVYDRNRIALMNYASLGFSIAHEINHAFDIQCRKFDKDGNAVQWWTQKSINEYKNITQCFIDQYNEYLVPGFEQENIRTNGQRSLGENMGDSAGIVAAYYAYKNRKARLNETNWRLQGLDDYSDDQIFFLAYAQFFCETALPEQIEQDIIWDPVHPLKEIRIRGSLSNSREFSEIYNCSLGDRMSPEKKCALWY